MLKSCLQPTPECTAYINGIIAGVLVDQLATEHGTPICFPNGIRTDDLRLTLSGFIWAHPEIWRADGNATVGVMLTELFPCRRSN